MKKLIIYSICLLISTVLMAQTPQQMMQKGNEAYSRGDYEAAEDAYQLILATGLQSAELYYNLGNAYYRQDELGLAILNYERALRLNPHFRDARQNLDLAYSKTEDEIPLLPKIFLVKWAQAVVGWLSPTGWLIVLIIVASCMGALTLFFFTNPDYGTRRTSLLIGIPVAFLLLLTTACTISSHLQASRHDQAIITSPMVVIKSSPETRSIDKMILHEGTKVEIEETLGDWHKIHISDGNNGWIESSDITII